MAASVLVVIPPTYRLGTITAKRPMWRRAKRLITNVIFLGYSTPFADAIVIQFPSRAKLLFTNVIFFRFSTPLAVVMVLVRMHTESSKWRRAFRVVRGARIDDDLKHLTSEGLREEAGS